VIRKRQTLGEPFDFARA